MYPEPELRVIVLNPAFRGGAIPGGAGPLTQLRR